MLQRLFLDSRWRSEWRNLLFIENSAECIERRGVLRKMDVYMSGATPGVSEVMFYFLYSEVEEIQNEKSAVPSWLPGVENTKAPLLLCDQIGDEYIEMASRGELKLF